MSTGLSVRAYFKSKKKRYLANKSNQMFNATFVTGIYKKKINNLLKNNRVLAVALQNDRVKKEELLQENKFNANIIMFSRLKLASLSDSLKKVVTVLDETLALLQMHSSVSSSKFTPKNTICREEFKKQVKEVCMDPIPEDEESPQRKPNQTNNEDSHSSNKQSDHLSEEISPKIQIDVSDKCNEKPKKYKKTLKRKLNEKPPEKKVNKTYIVTNHELSQPITCVNKYKEISPAKIAATKSKELLNKKFAPEVDHKKASANQTVSEKGSQSAENPVWQSTKRVQNTQESSSKNESKTLDVACTVKSSVSPIKLLRDTYDFTDTSVICDCEKENVGSNKRQKMSDKKFKSLGADELASTVTKRKNYGRRSALTNLSSKINAENSKERGGNIEKCQIDDLVTTKQKSAGLMLATESYDDSRSYLQDLTLQQEEMVKNLAENTFLVTAEVHKSSELLETDKLKFCKTECFRQKEPIVLVQDVFQSGKSFCKSIARQTGDQLNRIPLELQLLEHCSSLKVIKEESIHSEDNSIDQTENKAPKTKIKNIEPPLCSEGEVAEQPLCQEKRTFRKRPKSVNYKECPLNLKQRR